MSSRTLHTETRWHSWKTL